MREIKFRAWFPEIQKMTYEHTIEEWISMSLGDLSDVVWLQYTGIRDKNGREVYEGDIVSDGALFGHFGEFTQSRYEVKCVNGCFVAECEEECAAEHVFENYHLLWDLGEVEVTGNIYENFEWKKVEE